MPYRSTTSEEKISKLLENRRICRGSGTSDESGSIASINLALTGELTDKIPDCMSEVIGYWIAVIQDAMPDKMRNLPEWRSLLPLAAGTGRDRETERLSLILAWMWNTVLPQVQHTADVNGFGPSWRSMTEQKTHAAACAASAAADTAAIYAAATNAAAAPASYAADTAAYAAGATHAADTTAATAAIYAAASATYGADTATYAARAARTATRATFWQHINPCKLLSQLITL